MKRAILSDVTENAATVSKGKMIFGCVTLQRVSAWRKEIEIQKEQRII